LKRTQTYLWLISVLYLFIGVCFVIFKPLYSDEGYYFWAAKNVWQGKLIYVDFLYHQLPLLPFIYAPFSDLGIYSYYILRFTSIIFTLLLIILIFRHVLRITGNYNAAVFGALLLVFNGMFIEWNSVIKMYSLDNLLCYMSFYIITTADLSKTEKLKIFICGLSLGIAANSRITYFAVCVIVFGYLIYNTYVLNRSKISIIFHSLYFLVGIAIPSILTLFFLISYNDDFLFGIIKHNLYAQRLLWVDESNILRWLKFSLMPQNFILIVFALMGAVKKFKHRILSALILLALFAGNAAGYYVNEYLTALIPFIVYAAAVNYERIKKILTIKNINFLKYVMIFYMVAFFIAVPDFRKKLEGKTLEPNVLELSGMVNYERSLKGEKIFSSWYVYTLLSDKKNDMLNNDYIYSCMIRIPTDEENKRYSIPDSAYISKLIKGKYFDVIVLNENSPFLLVEHKDMIKEYYKLDSTFGNTKYFVR
jgi:hypothetical protein